jgi:hypothetical protein
MSRKCYGWWWLIKAALLHITGMFPSVINLLLFLLFLCLLIVIFVVHIVVVIVLVTEEGKDPDLYSGVARFETRTGTSDYPDCGFHQSLQTNTRIRHSKRNIKLFQLKIAIKKTKDSLHLIQTSLKSDLFYSFTVVFCYNMTLKYIVTCRCVWL